MSHDERPTDVDPGTPSAAPPRRPAHSDMGSLSEESGHPPEQSTLHHHVSLLYEEQAEQFAAVVPFIRDGLERGDRCLYIYDDNTRAEVAAAMREAGIDVDAAVDAGDLSFHTADEPFLQDGSFEPDAAVDFAVDSVREATEERGYDTVRVTGEMTWVLDSDHELDSMIEYEQRLNTVFGARPVVGICQYDVTKFDPEVLNQIVRVHPSLVYAGSAARDFYYIPTADLLDSDRAEPTETAAQTLLERVTAYERLEQRERALSELTDATQELIQLDAEAIPDRAVDVVRTVLDASFASFWSYDETTGELERRSSSSDDEVTVALAERYREQAWEAFVSEQTVEFSDRWADADSEPGGPPVQSGVIVPLGRHGVICAGSARRDAFDDTTVDLARTLGANVEAALDRADRERLLAEKNEELERVNRLNRVIREISQSLVDADSREDIEQIVCDRLAASDPYQFAWIGEQTLETAHTGPRAWSSDHSGYLDTVTNTPGDESIGTDPISTAEETRTVQVVQDVLTDQSFAPWREPTLSAGFRACVAVPLVYDELCYGVLTLYADTPNVFDDQERAVLEELGELIAHSIDAAETKETLRADAVVELAFTVEGFEGPLARLARSVGSEIHFDGLVAGETDPAQLFFTTAEADPERVVSRGEAVIGISEIRVVRDGTAGCTFKAHVTEPTLASRVLEQQAVLRSLTVTDTETTVVVDLPSATDVRAFLSDLRRTYDDVDLVARRTADRPMRTDRELRETIDQELTNRQHEILETAYRSGFFESPRSQTGTEISETLDISQSTFTHHLREAERRLCRLVFDDS